MDPQRLIPYIRVSTDEQNNSVQDQLALVERYAALYGHALQAPVVDEDVSAGRELWKRPGGAELQRRLEAGEADGIVITEIDRAFRLAVNGLVTADWFEKRGLDIHTVHDRIDTSHPDGWMSFAMRLVNADWERRKIGYRTRRSLAGLRDRGRVYGPVPYGCVREGDHLYRDPQTWPIRERIAALAEQGEGMRAICRRLRGEGVPAPGGGRLWHASTLSLILRNHHDLQAIPEFPITPETEVSHG